MIKRIQESQLHMSQDDSRREPVLAGRGSWKRVQSHSSPALTPEPTVQPLSQELWAKRVSKGDCLRRKLGATFTNSSVRLCQSMETSFRRSEELGYNLRSIPS